MMTKEEKLEIIDNIKKAGHEGEVDYGEVIRSIEKKTGSVNKTEESSIDLPEGYLNKYYGLKPIEFVNTVRSDYEQIKKDTGIENKNFDAFINAINNSGIYPYKAKVTGNYSPEEGTPGGWGFFRDVDRYEMAYDREQNPLYLRYYKDGTYDMLDKKEFDDKKYFNYMPDKYKNMFSEPINEDNMTGDNRYKTYSNITQHQKKVLTGSK